jgi:hypothetical protein
VREGESVRRIASHVQAGELSPGHPDDRLICREMWRKMQEVHPALAEYGKFIDWNSYKLGRLQSEMRTEFKKSATKKKE